MQSLCLTVPLIRLCRQAVVAPGRAGWQGAVLLLLLAHTFLAYCQNQIQTPLQSLEYQARQWAAQQPAFRGKEVHVAALDARIPVQACQQTLQFEQPFAGQPSIRVRCMLPSWQLFITLNQGPAGSTSVASPAASVGADLQKVLVATEVLKRGTQLSPSMFVVKTQPAAGMADQLIQDPQWVANMELVRDLLPNTPLRTYDVKNAIMVKRGQDVLVTASAGQGFVITVKAEALQDGMVGERIRLKNTESGRFLSAEVTGPGAAKMK